MTALSSSRVHLGENTKRSVSALSHERKRDFSIALECLARDPEPDGHSKISLDWFPYQPGINAFAGRGYIMTCSVKDDGSLYIAAVR